MLYMKCVLHINSPCHAMWWKLGETGYPGSSLPESRSHGYFSILFYIIVALHCTFLNHSQLSLYDQNWRRYAPWSNRVSGLNLLTSKIIIISLIFLHIPVALHRTFSDHLQLCFYDQNWPTYEACGNGFSKFWFGPEKAGSPTLLQTAITLNLVFENLYVYT